jgi:cytochrome c peroxidase
VRLRASRPAALALALALAGCGGSDSPDRLRISPQAALGERIFNDASLSASGRQSCASCHVAATGDAQDNALAAQLGGADLSLQGSRTAPSIRYLAFGTAFRLDGGGTPSGGFFWDGRASSLAEQARRPFFNPVEMALASPADLAARLAKADYAQDFAALYGPDIFSRPDDALQAVGSAVQQFELEDVRLRAFSSKFDAFLDGKTTLSAAEARGLAAFEDPLRGNCSSCHTSAKSGRGTHPLFTNFTYHALGVPRNAELVANADPAHADLGLCAREGGDLAARADLCGSFKVPSLRNVALRRALFHNGRFKTLADAVDFYAQRDTRPELFYPALPDGSVDRYDDLPPQFKANVSRGEAPYDRIPGGVPAMSPAEVDDIVAFLEALTDGWTP